MNTPNWPAADPNQAPHKESPVLTKFREAVWVVFNLGPSYLLPARREALLEQAETTQRAVRDITSMLRELWPRIERMDFELRTVKAAARADAVFAARVRFAEIALAGLSSAATDLIDYPPADVARRAAGVANALTDALLAANTPQPTPLEQTR